MESIVFLGFNLYAWITIATVLTMFTIMLFVTARKGSDVDGLRAKILKQTKPYYVLSVKNHDEYKSTVSSLVDQMLATFTPFTPAE